MLPDGSQSLWKWGQPFQQVILISVLPISLAPTYTLLSCTELCALERNLLGLKRETLWAFMHAVWLLRTEHILWFN